MKPMTEQHLAILRRHMVEIIDMHFDLAGEEIGRDTLDPGVRRAVADVPRHLFVPEALAALAYQDTPLPIGFDKTISQPFLVALMTDLLDPRPHETVLEVGTGLGYQTAVLAGLAGRVWSVEVVEEFVAAAALRLEQLGHAAVTRTLSKGPRSAQPREPSPTRMPRLAWPSCRRRSSAAVANSSTTSTLQTWRARLANTAVW